MYPVLMKWLCCFCCWAGFSPSLTRVANESGFEYRFDAILASLGIIAANFIPIPMLVYGLMQLFHLLYQNLESKIQIQSRDDLWS